MSLPPGNDCKGFESDTPRATPRISDMPGTIQPQGSFGGIFLSWRFPSKPAKSYFEDDEKQRCLDSGLLFINQTGPAGPQARELKRLRSHVMNCHVRKRRKEVVSERKCRPTRCRIQPVLDADQFLDTGSVDPFDSLPVKLSSSNSRLLYYFIQNIAPLHYPRGPGVARRDPMSSTWVRSALTDTALLHSTLGCSSGHMLHFDSSPSMFQMLSSGFLSHTTETIRIINERLMDTSKAMTDETMGAIALLVTGQTRTGDYKEMNIHMHGLIQLVTMRGGLETLGMGGLLAGEILWCDNLTAFMSSTQPRVAIPEYINDVFTTFDDPEHNLILTDGQTSDHSSGSSLWSPALKSVLCEDLVAALRGIHTIMKLPETSPSLTEHDMLVYDRKRASIQHQLATVTSLAKSHHLYTITESCRLAAIIYSVVAMWGFKPPMILYGDLAKKLQKALHTIDSAIEWDGWSDMLLWTLFIGGYAALGRRERSWFSATIGCESRRRNLNDWQSVRGILEKISVYKALWDPLEILWGEATVTMIQEEGDIEGLRALAKRSTVSTEAQINDSSDQI